VSFSILFSISSLCFKNVPALKSFSLGHVEFVAAPCLRHVDRRLAASGKGLPLHLQLLQRNESSVYLSVQNIRNGSMEQNNSGRCQNRAKQRNVLTCEPENMAGPEPFNILQDKVWNLIARNLWEFRWGKCVPAGGSWAYRSLAPTRRKMVHIWVCLKMWYTRPF
jgi:hypothetical protein